MQKEISKEDLEKLYNEKPNAEICRILGITNPTLVRYLLKAGIPLKGKGPKKSKIIIKD